MQGSTIVIVWFGIKISADCRRGFKRTHAQCISYCLCLYFDTRATHITRSSQFRGYSWVCAQYPRAKTFLVWLRLFLAFSHPLRAPATHVSAGCLCTPVCGFRFFVFFTVVVFVEAFFCLITSTTSSSPSNVFWCAHAKGKLSELKTI